MYHYETETQYSEVKGWLKAWLLFSTIRATGLCIRGSRVKWRSVGIVDGADLFTQFFKLIKK